MIFASTTEHKLFRFSLLKFKKNMFSVNRIGGQKNRRRCLHGLKLHSLGGAQNGKCERHGGWLKEVIRKTALDMQPSTKKQLSTVVAECCGAKNRFYHRGGYSPYQLVFGSNPRLPQNGFTTGEHPHCTTAPDCDLNRN